MPQLRPILAAAAAAGLLALPAQAAPPDAHMTGVPPQRVPHHKAKRSAGPVARSVTGRSTPAIMAPAPDAPKPHGSAA